MPELDAIVCPVGGGGLLSGTAVAAKTLRPAIRIIGAEPAGADDAARSFESGQLQGAGQPHTIADGLRGALAPRTFAEIQAHVDAIARVSEASIIEGMRRLWEVLKIIVEPSGAVPYAAVQAGYAGLEGRRIGIVLTRREPGPRHAAVDERAGLDALEHHRDPLAHADAHGA